MNKNGAMANGEYDNQWKTMPKVNSWFRYLFTIQLYKQ